MCVCDIVTAFHSTACMWVIAVRFFLMELARQMFSALLLLVRACLRSLNLNCRIPTVSTPVHVLVWTFRTQPICCFWHGEVQGRWRHVGTVAFASQAMSACCSRMCSLLPLTLHTALLVCTQAANANPSSSGAGAGGGDMGDIYDEDEADRELQVGLQGGDEAYWLQVEGAAVLVADLHQPASTEGAPVLFTNLHTHQGGVVAFGLVAWWPGASAKHISPCLTRLACSRRRRRVRSAARLPSAIGTRMQESLARARRLAAQQAEKRAAPNGEAPNGGSQKSSP